MIRTFLVAFCMLASGIALAAPKIASVRVGEIYRELDQTKKLNAEIKTKRQALLTDARLNAYRSAFKELEQLQAQLIKVADHDRSTRESLMKTFNLKRQEALTLKREFENFQRLETEKIDKEMVTRMEIILTLIREKAAAVGKKNGYDWVIDTSGKTNSGLPFVLYSKQTEDITTDVLAAMGQTIAGAPPSDDN